MLRIRVLFVVFRVRRNEVHEDDIAAKRFAKNIPKLIKQVITVTAVFMYCWVLLTCAMLPPTADWAASRLPTALWPGCCCREIPDAEKREKARVAFKNWGDMAFNPLDRCAQTPLVGSPALGLLWACKWSMP